MVVMRLPLGLLAEHLAQGPSRRKRKIRKQLAAEGFTSMSRFTREEGDDAQAEIPT
jgi:hypothetical protein